MEFFEFFNDFFSELVVVRVRLALVDGLVFIYHQIFAVVREKRVDLGQLENGKRAVVLDALENLVRRGVLGVAVLVDLDVRLLHGLLGESSALCRSDQRSVHHGEGDVRVFIDGVDIAEGREIVAQTLEVILVIGSFLTERLVACCNSSLLTHSEAACGKY